MEMEMERDWPEEESELAVEQEELAGGDGGGCSLEQGRELELHGRAEGGGGGD
jgi:hypothetical protein